MDDRNREVKRVIAVVTETIHRPVMDEMQVWEYIEMIGHRLSFREKVEVLDEVCRRYGV